MNKKESLNRLFRPKSIAVFGGDAAAEVIRQCDKIGFDGEIWPVNPKRKSLEGRQCYAAVNQLPDVPDASFIATSPAVSIDVLRQLQAGGAGGAVCYASGFAETGEAGAKLQQKLTNAAGDMAFVGPNCHGFINYLDRVALWPDEHGGTVVEKGVAIILQSGNVGISISMHERSLPISHLITVGNMADLGMHDYIDALIGDDRVTAIGLHIEGLDDIENFSVAAIRALRKKIPLVAMKTGTSALGAVTAMSHTSSLAGADEMYTALFERLGIARTETIVEFVETLKFLSVNGPLHGCSIASMSCSGGEASMIADQAEKLDLKMVAFSDHTKNKLVKLLGERVQIANPLDYHTYIWGDYATMLQCFKTVLEETFDCSILVLDYPREGVCSMAAWEIAEKALVDAVSATGQRAVVMSTMSENLPAMARERLIDAGVSPMQGLRECLQSIRAAAFIGDAQARDTQNLAVPHIPTMPAESSLLDEVHSKSLIAEFGIPVPNGVTCITRIADDVTDDIHYPVCLKIVSKKIAHKSDGGGVVLNIVDRNALHSAMMSMQYLTGTFLIEEMITDVIAEVIVGVKRDAQFGLVVVIGSGGILVELIRDSVTLLLPLTEQSISVALDKLRVSKLINGFRGRPAGDRAATIEAILNVQKFALNHQERLLELDINPLLIRPAGKGVIAVDALLRMAAA